MQEWKTVLEQECQESKWQTLAAQCNAKKNFGLANGVKYPQVTLDMVEEAGGIEYWDGMHVVVQASQVTDDKQNLGSHWLPFAPLDSPGLSWGSLSFLGLSLTPLDSPGLHWAYALACPELSWAFLRSPGLAWAPLGSPDLSWTLLGSPAG